MKWAGCHPSPSTIQPPREWPLQYSYSWDKNLPWHGPRKLPASSWRLTRYPCYATGYPPVKIAGLFFFKRIMKPNFLSLNLALFKGPTSWGVLKMVTVRSGQMTKNSTHPIYLIHNLSFFLNAGDMHEIWWDIMIYAWDMIRTIVCESRQQIPNTHPFQVHPPAKKKVFVFRCVTIGCPVGS